MGDHCKKQPGQKENDDGKKTLACQGVRKLSEVWK